MQTLRAERDDAVEKAERLESVRTGPGRRKRAKKQGKQARKRAAQKASWSPRVAISIPSRARKDQLEQRLERLSSQADASTDRVDEQVQQLEQAREREQKLEGRFQAASVLASGDESVRGELESLEQEKSKLSNRLSSKKKSRKSAPMLVAPRRAPASFGLARESDAPRALKDARQKGRRALEALNQLEIAANLEESVRSRSAGAETKRAESDLENTEQRLARRELEF